MAAPSAPRGTADFVGAEAQALLCLRRRAQALLEGAGYEPIETPIFEATDLFARGVGADTDLVRKEMYTFTDQGGRSLTLRPEGTAAVVRAYIQHGLHKRSAPCKLWYCGPFFRYERAQAGRYRQFWQVGAEAFGADDPALDAELIVLLVRVAEAAGVGNPELRISTLGSPESRRPYRRLLQRYLLDRASRLPAEVRARIETNPLRAFDAKDEPTKEVMAGAPVLLDHLPVADRERLEEVCALIGRAGVRYTVDPHLVRGLDYYSQTVFELTAPGLGAQNAVGGGGRYDRLVEELGGPATPAAGFAAGLERLLLAAKDRFTRKPNQRKLLYITYSGERPSRATRELAFRALLEAWASGLVGELEVAGRSLRRSLQRADRLGASAVLIVSESGLALKELAGGNQEPVALAALGERLRALGGAAP